MVFFGNFLLTTKESYSCRSTKLPIPRPQAQHLLAAGVAPPARAFLLSPTAPFLPTAEEMGERTPAETAFLHFLSALCLFTATRAFPHVTGVFLIVVVPPTVPAQLSAAAACYYGKNYSFCRVAGYYILCPTGTPTFAAARRQRRDLIIANPVEANTPTVAGASGRISLRASLRAAGAVKLPFTHKNTGNAFAE